MCTQSPFNPASPALPARTPTDYTCAVPQVFFPTVAAQGGFSMCEARDLIGGNVYYGTAYVPPLPDSKMYHRSKNMLRLWGATHALKRVLSSEVGKHASPALCRNKQHLHPHFLTHAMPDTTSFHQSCSKQVPECLGMQEQHLVEHTTPPALKQGTATRPGHTGWLLCSPPHDLSRRARSGSRSRFPTGSPSRHSSPSAPQRPPGPGVGAVPRTAKRLLHCMLASSAT